MTNLCQQNTAEIVINAIHEEFFSKLSGDRVG